jgi:hypothetical protein
MLAQGGGAAAERRTALKRGSKSANYAGVIVAVVVFLSLGAPAYGQEKTPADTKTKPNCNGYRVDNAKNRVYFNAPEPWIAIPTQAERNQLRVQGELGQVFVMENCDTPDLISKVKVYANADDGEPAGQPTAEIVSGQPALILEQRGDWYRVKGRPANVGAPEIWKGEGWVKADKKVIVVKY